jgi:hypothetical protein
MSYLPSDVIGRWFYLYLILDLYSRKIAGWEIHDADDADHAAHLVKRTALAEGNRCARRRAGPARRQRREPVRTDTCFTGHSGHILFAGQKVGIKEESDGVWSVAFMDYDIGFFDLTSCRVEPTENPFGPKVLTMSPE